MTNNKVKLLIISVIIFILGVSKPGDAYGGWYQQLNKESQAGKNNINNVIAGGVNADSFSFIVLPDSQNYSWLYPEIFIRQTKWIVDNKEKLNIKYVAHMGDIIDSRTSMYQWENANAAMSILDNAGIPYGVLAGNHDNNYGTDYTQFAQYFGEWRFKSKPWFGRSYDAANKHHYDLINAGKYKFLILYISFADKADLPFDWFKQVIESNRDKAVIISTHRYINLPYNVSPDSATQAIRDFAVQYDNVKLVLSGHVALKPDIIVNNSIRKGTLHEILQDYQNEPNGGNGWLRIYTFDDNDNVSVKTYSPYLNQYGASFSFSLSSGSLASFWSFDEGAGGTALDSSGNANSGIINGAVWASGKINKALSFDGINDYVGLGDKFEYPEGTISMWFKRNTDFNSSTVKDEYMYTKNKNAFNAGDVVIAFNGSQNIDNDGHLTFSMDDQNNFEHIINSDSNNWPSGIWHQVAVTWGLSGMRMYIDGVLQKETDSYAGGVLNTDLKASIGGSQHQNNYYFNGIIDEVKIHNRALSENEILSEYKTTIQETVSPKIAVTSPLNNQVVTAPEIKVSGTAADNVALDRVVLRVNNDRWQTVSGTSSWSKTLTLVPGINDIRVVAFDTSAKTAGAGIKITYNPSYSETIKPVVSITSLTNGQNFIIPVITISGTAKDNAGLSRIDVKVNSNPWQLASGTTSWSKTITFISGLNTITARATDISGNIKEASVTVTYTPPTSDPAGSFSFIVLPDTQNYSTLYPEIFTKQTQWIIDNKETLNIKYVAHLGDIIDGQVSPSKVPVAAQWENASTAMSLLDHAGIPYGVLAGNHDNRDGTDYNLYAQYFGETRFKGKQWFGKSYDTDNKYHYDLINAGKYKFLILNISYDQAADLPLDWFKQVIEANSDKTVIITTHAYLNRPYNVIDSLDSVPAIRDLAMKHSNVKMVLSGHVSIKPEFAAYTSIRKGTLREIMQDYQYGPNGGNGWLNIYTFDNKDNVTVKTYSPYLNQYGASFSFSLNLDNLASFWNFDENTGTTASDSSGYDNTGTINGATWTSGKIRKALNFDGVNDYVGLGDKFEYPEGTISMWFNRNTAFNSTTVNDEYIYNKNKNGPNAGDVTVAFNGSQNIDGDGHITFSIDDRGGKGHAISSNSNNWPAGAWHYLTVTWGALGMKMYVDGVLQQDTDTYSGGISDNSLNLSIGGSQEQNNYFYNGKIDEIKIYNHALSKDEIVAEYKFGSTDFTKPTVKILSPLNNLIVATPEILISGSASDNIAIDRTDIRVNDDPWQTIPKLTSWNKTISLVPGTNLIRAWGNDIFGNHNTASVNITYNPSYQETTKPSISITSLTNGQNFAIPTVTVSGTASDNAGLSRIDLKANSGSWQLASGTTSWSKPITFKVGANIIYARAIDESGNIREISVNVTYTPSLISSTPQ